jgi:D-alanyl-D-alanine carboxypeptidase
MWRDNQRPGKEDLWRDSGGTRFPPERPAGARGDERKNCVFRAKSIEMSRRLCVIAALAAVAAAALPCTSGAATFSAAMASRITTMAQREVRTGRAPGIAIAVAEDGRVVYARGFGFANGAEHVLVRPATEFYAGEVTMQFTAAAILLLEQAGKLALDDPVTKYVPGLTVAKGVTIRQLLQQTSGLPVYEHVLPIANDQTRPVKYGDLIAAVDGLKASAPPGTQYRENPLNYIVAGLIVQRVSGVPLSDFLQQQIFLPLVMQHSFLAGDTGISPRHAVGYTRVARGFARAPVWDPSWLFGGRDLVTTVGDLAKWDIEMPILLRVDSVRTMFAPGTARGPIQAAMGWISDVRNGKPYLWYTGEISGYQASNALLPEDHLAVIVLTNTDAHNVKAVLDPQALAGRILDVIEPPQTTRLRNAIVTLAEAWLQRLADKRIDRTQLTPAFSDYLSDALVARANLASLGKLQPIVPISSSTTSSGDTTYEFLVKYPHAQYHYLFTLAPDGKIDGIFLRG